MYSDKTENGRNGPNVMFWQSLMNVHTYYRRLCDNIWTVHFSNIFFYLTLNIFFLLLQKRYLFFSYDVLITVDYTHIHTLARTDRHALSHTTRNITNSPIYTNFNQLNKKKQQKNRFIKGYVGTNVSFKYCYLLISHTKRVIINL